MQLNLSNWFGQSYITYKAVETNDSSSKYQVNWFSTEQAGRLWDAQFAHMPPNLRPFTREEYIESLSLQRMLTDRSSMSNFIGQDRDIKVSTNPEVPTGAAPDYLDDFILTKSGNDFISTYGGDDLVFSDGGNDAIFTDVGNDVVFAGKGADLVFGGAGRDQIFGDAALQKGQNGFDPKISTKDVEEGISFTNSTTDAGQNGKIYVDYNDGESADTLYGNGGDDYIDGGKGNDVIFGGADNDTLLGGDGADIIFGEAGNDLIDAGPRGVSDDNLDQVWGGAGADTFLLTGSKNGSNQSFVDQWASENSVATTTNLITSTLSDAATTAITDGLQGIGTKVLGSFATGAFGPLGGAILDIGVGLIMDELTGNKPKSADMVRIMDFNPAEDILAIPARLGVQLKYTVEPSTVNGQTTIKLLLTYQPDVTETNILETDAFAEINLDPAFLHSIGYTPGDTETATAIFEDLIKGGVSINPDGLGNIYDPDTPAAVITGDYIQLIGAVGPLVRDGKDDNDQSPVVGGRFADIITANEAFVDPAQQLSVTTGTGGELKSTSVEIHGLGGADIIYGSTAADRLFGGAGDDVIYSFGTDGDVETIEGGSGDDKVITGMANVDLNERNYYSADGGNGFDIFDLDLNPRGVILQGVAGSADNLVVGRESDATIDNYSLTDFESFLGTNFADEMDLSALRDRFTLSGRNGDDLLVGSRGDDTIMGGNGNDTLRGGEGHDELRGGRGEDVIDAGDGDDLVVGGAGDDSVDAGAGRDTVYAGTGDDTVMGGEDDDVIYGELGDDALYGDAGRDIIFGKSGNDFINGGDGDDRAFGGDGEDTIEGGAGDDFLWGFNDADVINGGLGNDTLVGGLSGDTLNGGEGHDTLRGESGDDLLLGGAGRDLIFGGSGADTIEGGSGDDRLEGGTQGDLVSGGTGDDVIRGGDGFDTLNGDAGNDRLFGDNGWDTLDGGAGNDTLSGGSGRDQIIGGTGNDTLNGGDQADTFIFAAGSGNDRINDFAILEDQILIELGNGLEQGDVTVVQVAADRAQVAYGTDSIDVFGTDAGTLALDDLNFV